MTEQSRPDVLVIGAGIVGLSTAWFLRERGCAVHVIDRGPIEGTASTGNAGMIAAGHPPMPQPKLLGRTLRLLLDPLGPLYVRPRVDPALIRWFWEFRRACGPRPFARSMHVLADFGRLSRDSFAQIVRDGGIDCGYSDRGWLEVYRTPAGRDRVRQACEPERAEGFRIAFLEDGALQAQFPVFKGEVLGAAHHLDSSFAHPDAFMTGLAARLRDRGVEIRTDAEVAMLEIERGRCTGARLADGGVVRAQATVLAAGVWSTAIARTAGVRIPMEAGKGYHLSVPDPGLPIASVMSETYVACTPMAGRLRLAGTVELSGINLTIRRKRLEMLPRGAALYLRGLDASDRLDAWCGLRPCTADGLPAIGATRRVGSLFIGTGHAMMGFALGPGTGRVLAGIICGDAPPALLAPFDPDRWG